MHMCVWVWHCGCFSFLIISLEIAVLIKDELRRTWLNLMSLCISKASDKPLKTQPIHYTKTFT